MEDNPVEIHEDEINVEEIMKKIRENIRMRQAREELFEDMDSVIASPSMNCHSDPDSAIRQDLSYINSNWDIHNNSYFISSHHPYIGKFLVQGRQLIHGEVRRYVDPIISRQTELNASSVRIITRALQRVAGLDQRQQELGVAFSSFKSELDSKIELTIKEHFTQIDQDIHARAWLARVLEERIQTGLAQKSAPRASISGEISNYFLFEERFRGSREDIKKQQLAFLPYFEKCSRVLDIGCGRGEFLESLKAHEINGIGVDNDPDMVAYCRSRKLEVVHSDAIAYLETLEDKNLDGIFIDQVVEHLEPDYLIRLLALCYQKLKYGYYIVVETVNPLSLVSFFNFYLDMSHQKPVHPFTLKFLLESNQYREIELKYFSEIPEKAKLQKIHQFDSCTESERQFLAIYNYNIDMLNLLLWGPMDYAVIGKK